MNTGWTSPYQHSSAPINVPSALHPLSYCFIFCLFVFFFVFFHDLCSILRKLGRSNWCYCETNPTGKQIRSTITELLKQTKCVCPPRLFPTKRGGKQPQTKRRQQKKKKPNIPVECGCLVHFQSVEIVTLCVCMRACVCFVFFPCQQAATTSYSALAYFIADNRNGTNQDIEKQHTHTKNSNKEKVRITTNFGVDVRTLSSSNKQ